MSQVAITRYSEKEKRKGSQESETDNNKKKYKQTSDPRNSVPDNLWIEWETDYHKNKNEDCRR